MHGSATTKGNIPLQDQHLALAILLELAVQRGTLRLAAHLHITELKVFRHRAGSAAFDYD